MTVHPTACRDCGTDAAVDRNGRCEGCARMAHLVAASTPDPDSGFCQFCGGGLAHYPECPEWTGGPNR